MSDDTLAAFSALYRSLDQIDEHAVAARGAKERNPNLLAVRIGEPDPAGFKAALDDLIPSVQADFDAARRAHDFDRAEAIESVLSRLYFWRIFARGKLIEVLDGQDSNEVMAALRMATGALQATKREFDQGGHDTDTAMQSLDDLAKAVGVKPA